MNARAPILALKDVRLQDGPVMLFDGVDLAIEPRVRASLVGRNGAGKSTLMRMLMGQVEPDAGDRFVVPGLRIAVVPQEPDIQGATMRDYACAGGAEPHQAEARLQAFGLDPDKTATDLSGGEARRAALARAFAEDADVLLLDEPTNHLDILAIETLEETIRASRAACLIVSHDRAFLERVTQRCFWLENRKVRRLDRGFSHFDEWAEGVLAQEAEDSRRLDKQLEREEHWLLRGVTARRARNEGRRRKLLGLRQEKSERMRQLQGAASIAVDASGTSGQRVVEAKGLCKTFGGRALLANFSTRIRRGDRVAIVGPNGAGKTTLVKLLLGQLAPDAGEVGLGANLQIAYVDQARAALKPETTLWEVLAPAGGDQILVHGKPRHVAAYAKDFLFKESQLRQPVQSLSGGERNRLLLARALATPANLLVLDEPTNDLDMDTLDLLEEILADYEGTLILVSHDRDFIDRLATSTIALDGRGRTVETPGGWKDFLRQNPGFFTAVAAPAAAVSHKAAAAPAAAQKIVAKLSYKDSRRLSELETLVPRLTDQIRTLEERLHDPGLYARDKARFERLMGDLDKARAALSAAEDEWLVLEQKRESLAG